MAANFSYLIMILIYLGFIIIIPHLIILIINLKANAKSSSDKFVLTIINNNIRLEFGNHLRWGWAQGNVPQWITPLADSKTHLGKPMSTYIVGDPIVNPNNIQVNMATPVSAQSFGKVLNKQFRYENYKATFFLPRNFARIIITLLILLSIVITILETGTFKDNYMIMITIVISFYLGSSTLKDEEIDDLFCVTNNSLRQLRDFLNHKLAKFIFILFILGFLIAIMVFIGIDGDFYSDLLNFVINISIFFTVLFVMTKITPDQKKVIGPNVINLSYIRTFVGMILIFSLMIFFFSELTLISDPLYPILVNLDPILQVFIYIFIPLYFGTIEK